MDYLLVTIPPKSVNSRKLRSKKIYIFPTLLWLYSIIGAFPLANRFEFRNLLTIWMAQKNRFIFTQPGRWAHVTLSQLCVHQRIFITGGHANIRRHFHEGNIFHEENRLARQYELGNNYSSVITRSIAERNCNLVAIIFVNQANERHREKEREREVSEQRDTWWSISLPFVKVKFGN